MNEGCQLGKHFNFEWIYPKLITEKWIQIFQVHIISHSLAVKYSALSESSDIPSKHKTGIISNDASFPDTRPTLDTIKRCEKPLFDCSREYSPHLTKFLHNSNSVKQPENDSQSFLFLWQNPGTQNPETNNCKELFHDRIIYWKHLLFILSGLFSNELK